MRKEKFIETPMGFRLALVVFIYPLDYLFQDWKSCRWPAGNDSRPWHQMNATLHQTNELLQKEEKIWTKSCNHWPFFNVWQIYLYLYQTRMMSD